MNLNEWDVFEVLDLVIRDLRDTASRRLLGALSWASQTASRQQDEVGLSRLLILGGPLRGTYVLTPALTRLSFALGTYQRHVGEVMEQFVAEGCTAYDLGAHMGYFSLVLARLVGSAGNVFSFEPDPRNLRALRRNIRFNRATNISVVPVAVADHSGRLTFASFAFSSVSHIADGRGVTEDAHLVEVDSVSLDDFVYGSGNPAPAFIKIDVEGAEVRALRGARRLLGDARPVIVVEARAREWQTLQNLMASLGYRARVLGRGPQEFQARQIADVLFQPR